MKSKDASKWEKFRVIIASTNGKAYEAPLTSLGFKPDGRWHRCRIDLKDVKDSGVDLTRIKTLFAIGWEVESAMGSTTNWTICISNNELCPDGPS